MKRLPVILVLLSMSGCGFLNRPIRSWMPMIPGPEWRPEYRFQSNGEQIYFTGSNNRGDVIIYTGGPDFGGMMMGGWLACATCHGPNGRGGLHRMHMTVMNAPDIRYVALNSEEEMKEHGDNHGEYSLEDFKRAVVYGEHPDEEPLSLDMPRWQISDQDLIDLFSYLKSLP